ncbi:MAG TPA: 3-deoxy-manno-octulosonate cytidylyltransferase [Syntrophorhabdaceae bacterium]|nr:3-deoxy-manno-octulosonate cytidylyltransferase [Syntrophorhabdaceae bacterium]
MISKKKNVIVIPARYASTRLPGKPLVEIKGKPLIQWVFENAMKSQLKDEIYIATDDKRIMERARAFGAEVIMTSKDCSSGTERIYEALKEKEADIIVNVQGDEPFIRYDMIDALFLEMKKKRIYMATLCCKINDMSEVDDPNTVKVVLNKKGYALYFSRSPIPYFRNNSHTKKKLVYKHIGVYGYTKDFLKKYINMKRSFLEEAESLEQLRVLENGYKIKVLITEYDGFGIDTKDDLLKAEKYLEER